MWEEDIPLCVTVECEHNDYGECTIDPADCPYLQNQDFWKENSMDKKKIEQLYKLLYRAEKEHDAEAVSALRWAILNLEN